MFLQCSLLFKFLLHFIVGSKHFLWNRECIMIPYFKRGSEWKVIWGSTLSFLVLTSNLLRWYNMIVLGNLQMQWLSLAFWYVSAQWFRNALWVSLPLPSITLIHATATFCTYTACIYNVQYACSSFQIVLAFTLASFQSILSSLIQPETYFKM